MIAYDRKGVMGLAMFAVACATACGDGEKPSALFDPGRSPSAAAPLADVAGAATATVAQLTGPGNQCLNVAGNNLAPGGSVIVWPCQGGWSGNELWTVQPAAGGAEVRVYQKNLCLDDRAGTGAAGASVYINACNGAPTQRWTVNAAGQVESSAGTCLATAGGSAARGAAAVLAACSEGAPTWRVVGWRTVPAPAPTPAPTGTPVGAAATESGYTSRQPAIGQLVATASSRCLNVAGNNMNPGATLITWTCQGGWSGNEMWVIPAAGDTGQVRVHARELCLDDRSGAGQAGSAATLARCSTAPSQRWTVTGAGQLRSAAGTCLTTAGGTAGQGTPAVVAACAAGTAQRWRVNVFGTTNASTVVATAPGAGAAPTANGATPTFGNNEQRTQTFGPATPPPAATVAMQIVRFTPGTGSVLVSSGVPLKPGMLFASQVGRVRAVVAGREQSAYVEALAGRHPDGSLTTVLVQFRYSLPQNVPVPAQLVIGTAPTVAALARPTENRAMPAAAFLPTDPNYLVATRIVGPTLTAAASAAAPGGAKYDDAFVWHATRLYGITKDNWGENFYDRVRIYYAHWARTGNAEYWRRAAELNMSWRHHYIQPNFATTPWYASTEGLAYHYQLTGDDSSRYTLGRLANQLAYFSDRSGDPNNPDIDNRGRAKALITMVHAHRLNAKGDVPTDWSVYVDRGINGTVNTQRPDGSYHFSVLCNASQNYMDGMMNDALISAYNLYRADPRIVTAVTRWADWAWRTQWVPAVRGFKYASTESPTSCPYIVRASGVIQAQPELNMLMVNAFGFAYAMTGNAEHRTRGDEVFTGATSQNDGILFYGKQFNQHYMSSYAYLAYRAGVR